MNKLEFEALGPKLKINFMNESLKTGSTLTIISEEIGISRKTIAKRLKEIGYTYDKQQKQFLKLNEYKHNINIIKPKTVKNKEVIPIKHKPNINIFNSKEATDKILDIVDKHDDIAEMLQWYHNQRNVIEVAINDLKIDSDKLHGEMKTTTVRLYSEVWEQFREFMEGYKEYKSMDLISMAMVEYMERYKK
ncbi:DUF4250 family protein [Clostridium estertheticum]|uniref:DUF4250 family protein n=1 Tax=Clostridium estertheticum TaxID=238834 RepID=UPI001C6E80DF|nr:DUF4250 family protein [Clostridium estertheticum]MBW9154271.1 DUF4250 domain-containing protein [Clostridium estertheticum]WLC86697.1 DUF4250 domain-containing protein [Clostridium estertheticum]